MTLREPRMTLADAAARARTTTTSITAALESGDLRDLRPSNLDKWRRAQLAALVVPGRSR